MPLSLDGFVASPNGEMNRIKVDEEIFDHVGKWISRKVAKERRRQDILCVLISSLCDFA
ncbi:MAG TPA: hypothetical protein VFT15_01180 [Chitinophagaceae bacterium]|nr:hypothetical protein [Chitinophagaceae bacterium]